MFKQEAEFGTGLHMLLLNSVDFGSWGCVDRLRRPQSPQNRSNRYRQPPEEMPPRHARPHLRRFLALPSLIAVSKVADFSPCIGRWRDSCPRCNNNAAEVVSHPEGGTGEPNSLGSHSKDGAHGTGNRSQGALPCSSPSANLVGENGRAAVATLAGGGGFPENDH